MPTLKKLIYYKFLPFEAIKAKTNNGLRVELTR